MGQFLTEEASKAEVIVEIGTGSALGSTACFAKGMRKHGKAVLYTVEGDQMQAEVAARNIQLLMVANNVQIELLNGILHRNVTAYSHPIDMIQHKECWQFEKALSQQAPIVEIPDGWIDVLLLDGGEYTTYDDFLLLADRSKLIVLDDVNPDKAVKTAAVHDFLSTVPTDEFDMIRHEPGDRNGWSAFRRRNQ